MVVFGGRQTDHFISNSFKAEKFYQRVFAKKKAKYSSREAEKKS
jgi:hypothetical protein